MFVTHNPNQICHRTNNRYHQKKQGFPQQAATQFKLRIIHSKGRFLEGKDIIVTSDEINIFLIFGIISK